MAVPLAYRSIAREPGHTKIAFYVKMRDKKHCLPLSAEHLTERVKIAGNWGSSEERVGNWLQEFPALTCCDGISL